MTKVLNHKSKAGSKESHEPRLIGEILREYFSSSNEPLAQAYRERNGMVEVKQSNADNYGKE
ncbi:MAG: hypothetical protein MJZ41_13020 [Bacteroidaceae bacterium]|nr:hypothetical protein [Bacteroidaceae bacterium]